MCPCVDKLLSVPFRRFSLVDSDNNKKHDNLNDDRIYTVTTTFLKDYLTFFVFDTIEVILFSEYFKSID